MTFDPCPNCRGTGLVPRPEPAPHIHHWVRMGDERRCTGCHATERTPAADLTPDRMATKGDGIVDCTPLADQVEAAMKRVREAK